MSLSLLARGSVVDCMELMPGGTRARLILMNFDDVASYEVNADGIITNIKMKNNTLAYEFNGFRDDTQFSEEVVKPEIGVAVYAHKVGLTVYELTQEQKNNIHELTRGSFVAIVENRGLDDHSFEVLGKAVGLQIVAGPIRDAYEDGGFFTLSLSTAEDEHEPKLPQTLGTTYEQAQEIIINILRPRGLLDSIIMESGDSMLQENGEDFILKE